MSSHLSPSTYPQRVKDAILDDPSACQHPSPIVLTPDTRHRYSQSNASIKPVLKFSIARILGLTSDTAGPHVAADESVHEIDNLDDSEEEIIHVEDTDVMKDDLCQDNMDNNINDNSQTPRYQWLQCTRYHPPKLHRNKQKDGTQKRKMGRNPRVPFTQHQVVVLENKFKLTHYLSSHDVTELSSTLGLTDARVKIWFQNRRARDRREKETAQLNQKSTLQKKYQPLSVPTVNWPTQVSITSTNYMQYQNNQTFIPMYSQSALGVYTSYRQREELFSNPTHSGYKS